MPARAREPHAETGICLPRRVPAPRAVVVDRSATSGAVVAHVARQAGFEVARVARDLEAGSSEAPPDVLIVVREPGSPSGSFVNAAARLNVTQSTVSARVRAL